MVFDDIVHRAADIEGVFPLSSGSDRHPCLSDSWLVSQSQTLTWTVALGRLIVSDVFRLCLLNAVIVCSWFADGHVTCLHKVQNDAKYSSGTSKWIVCSKPFIFPSVYNSTNYRWRHEILFDRTRCWSSTLWILFRYMWKIHMFFRPPAQVCRKNLGFTDERFSFIFHRSLALSHREKAVRQMSTEDSIVDEACQTSRPHLHYFSYRSVRNLASVAGREPKQWGICTCSFSVTHLKDDDKNGRLNIRQR